MQAFADAELKVERAGAWRHRHRLAETTSRDKSEGGADWRGAARTGLVQCGPVEGVAQLGYHSHDPTLLATHFALTRCSRPTDRTLTIRNDFAAPTSPTLSQPRHRYLPHHCHHPLPTQPLEELQAHLFPETVVSTSTASLAGTARLPSSLGSACRCGPTDLPISRCAPRKSST
ncbi:hypothetical protein BCR44DRAFT_1216637 [Catenaria anguillulae PL171]|uniref:Uncharacterized protein n=1 Tax=Catenaria anguillulae PL171 TaxID=765915 RepID=A0A1Y2HZ23_9FUNG|nr:hypothetical protein BCR44DRAFT_1216637 [Catenaria anguillulae PL171]